MALKSKNTQKLSKFLSYVLGRRPDEFGLVLDEKGFTTVKELLKSLNEEEGWRHIRLAHLKEVIFTLAPAPIEIEDNRIRAKVRTQLPTSVPLTERPPKLLYIAVRRRAYPVIVEKGLQVPTGRSHLVLSPDENMARRIGRRIDHQAALLTVQVAESLKKGTRLQKYGRHLFLADVIYPNTFSGPPLPKERPESVKPGRIAEPEQPKTPGSYFPELSPPEKPRRRRKEVDWKKDRRKARRHKARQQR